MFVRLLALFACCQLLETPAEREEDVPLPPPPTPPRPPSPPRNAFIIDDDEEDYELRRSVFQAMNNDERDGNDSDYDDDDDELCDDDACARESILQHRPWKRKQKIAAQSKKAMTDDYNHQVWVVTPDGSSHSVLTCLVNGQTYRVSNNRVRKALLAMDPTAIGRQVFLPKSCSAHCKHQCWTNFTVNEILTHRGRHVTCATEGEINETIARHLSVFNTRPGGAPGDAPKFQYVVNGKHVCADFYAVAEGISVNKLKEIRSMVKEGSVHYIHGNKGMVSEERQRRHTQGVAFWNWFCLFYCQRPATVEDILLFPLAWPYDEIYEAMYLPWHAKCYPHEAVCTCALCQCFLQGEMGSSISQCATSR